ncbi:hypothetical protein B0T16DRAFT_518310 [Cercophora newfieldiana]|uniref:Uncharacterized protein n=1 Tax=Cercophora newfieldiana TaxID=92897 RepID=A0AA39XSI2_9PEZI|nr:hypothetical protein B0T16DRAFT_518310 [Cercophora newfieldiana]
MMVALICILMYVWGLFVNESERWSNPGEGVVNAESCKEAERDVEEASRFQAVRVRRLPFIMESRAAGCCWAPHRRSLDRPLQQHDPRRGWANRTKILTPQNNAASSLDKPWVSSVRDRRRCPGLLGSDAVACGWQIGGSPRMRTWPALKSFGKHLHAPSIDQHVCHQPACSSVRLCRRPQEGRVDSGRTSPVFPSPGARNAAFPGGQ